tara:strand:+ start:661 stop:945 length:285 start_codon:yes stop_codon:yes gene_type:complete
MANYNPNNKVTPLGLVSSPELSLWRAVLATAASDAVNDSYFDYKGYPRGAKRSADRDYFLNPSRSFYQVCYWAALEPEYVLRKMKKALCRKTPS